MFRYKFKLFTISLIAVWLVLFVKNVDIPLYFGCDYVFVGWKRIVTYGNVIALFSLGMFIAALLFLHQLFHRFKGSPDGLSITITEVKDRSFDYVNTLATIVTLFSVIIVPVNSFRDFIVFSLLIVVICVCYLKTNLYYSNPIFAALGYRIYTVDSNSKKLPNGSIAIYKGQLQKTDVKSYHISDNVYYLEKE